MTFNLNSYKTDLGITDPKESAYLSRLLKWVEGYLSKKGIVFYAPDATTKIKTWPGYYNGRQTFLTGYFDQVANDKPIKIKCYDDPDYSKELVDHIDYELSKHRELPNPVYCVELSEPITDRYYIEIDAKWGFDSKIPDDIDFEVFSLAQEAINKFAAKNKMHTSSGREVVSKSMGGVKVDYRPTSVTESGDSFANLFAKQTSLNSIINSYALKR